jgi:hypothetical protein
MAVPDSLRRQVVARAANRCEYCGLSEIGQAATFHIDHITPSSAGGQTELENLAYACVHCSLRKGARQQALDPITSEQVLLFHPRKDKCNLHSRWLGPELRGLTPTARTTIEALSLNSADHQIIRTFEAILGRHPPPGHR